MASGPVNFIVDADLHGLVDGHLEADRRADALRRLASSPVDRARVEAWQTQTDLLRRAFVGVDREPLPVMLDLKARPRLQCIPAEDSPRPEADGAPSHGRVRRKGLGVAVAMILLVSAGVAGTWMVMNLSDTDDPVASARLRTSIDATLAGRSTDAISRMLPTTAGSGDGVHPPTTRVPDLRKAGFVFTGAEFEPSEPASIVFRYQNGVDRLAISAAPADLPDGAEATPFRIGDAYSWRRRGTVFAIAGTLRPARLRALAITLQNGGDERAEP